MSTRLTRAPFLAVVATDNGSRPYSAVEKFLVHVVTVPPRVTAKSAVGGAASLSLQATNGQTLIVQRSTNLIDWLPWTTNLVVTPPLLLTDPGAAARPSSFYRAVIKP